MLILTGIKPNITNIGHNRAYLNVHVHSQVVNV